ncbi:MAG: response regulator [Deltaproteobacteria bacterium]|nr:response regulator [Deltaproteobacteria bacterium]
MDKETLEQCFDPFYTTKEVGKGTGLGLFTIYGIVKDHGGKLHVYSEPGKGTTFKLYLPMVTMGTTYIPKDEHVIIKGKGEKILFVDDEVEILEPLKELLEELDYRVAYVSSGKEAIDKYKSWKPDVVLLDRNMPEMDGINCAKRIIEHDGAARIVLVSGYDEVGPHGIDTETRALLKGYIVKPVRLKDLVEVFSRLFNA